MDKKIFFLKARRLKGSSEDCYVEVRHAVLRNVNVVMLINCCLYLSWQPHPEVLSQMIQLCQLYFQGNMDAVTNQRMIQVSLSTSLMKSQSH